MNGVILAAPAQQSRHSSALRCDVRLAFRPASRCTQCHTRAAITATALCTAIFRHLQKRLLEAIRHRPGPALCMCLAGTAVQHHLLKMAIGERLCCGSDGRTLCCIFSECGVLVLYVLPQPPLNGLLQHSESVSNGYNRLIKCRRAWRAQDITPWT